VQYRNRQENSDSINLVSLGGWYYFALQAAQREGETDWQTTTLISVKVSGTPTGAPQYADGAKPVDDPLASPQPPSGASEPAAEATPSGTAGGATGPSVKAEDGAERTETAAAKNDGGTSALP
jgi:hypothetical protein